MTRPGVADRSAAEARGDTRAGGGRRAAETGFVLVSALLVLVGTGVLLLVTAAPAAAHSALVSSSPADGSRLASAPGAVVLTFNQPALALGTQILVTGPEGPVSQGEPELVDEEVRQALAPGAPAGRYTVDWRVSSADGHPITGQLTFTADAAGAGQASAPDGAAAPDSTRDASGQGADPGTGTTAWAAPVLGGLAVVAAAVALVLRRRALGRGAASRA